MVGVDVVVESTGDPIAAVEHALEAFRNGKSVVMVTVEADGKGVVKRVKIDPSVVNPADVEMLEDLVAVAVGEAQRKATDLAQQEMGKLTGGLNLPFPFKLPF